LFAGALMNSLKKLILTLIPEYLLKSYLCRLPETGKKK